MTKKRAAFQGERGAFSEEAAYKLLGKSVLPIACDSFESVFDKVESKQAEYGVIPIENSLIGSIHKNNDLLLERDLTVIGETQLRVVHCLIALPGTSIKRIARVFSHPAALDQCRNFFKKHQKIEPVSYYDTAGAVKMLTESKMTDAAAIASPFAAKIYKMRQLKNSIEDKKFNFTRFLLLARRAIRFKGKAKTSIVFSLKNEPGALFKALSVFALRDIDLTKIESHPSRRRAWEYHFYIDFIGSVSEPAVKNALNHLREIAPFMKVLGSYPMHTGNS